MSGTRYTAESKVEAVKQVTERGHGVVEIAKRLDTPPSAIPVPLQTLKLPDSHSTQTNRLSK